MQHVGNSNQINILTLIDLVLDGCIVHMITKIETLLGQRWSKHPGMSIQAVENHLLAVGLWVCMPFAILPMVCMSPMMSQETHKITFCSVQLWEQVLPSGTNYWHNSIGCLMLKTLLLFFGACGPVIVYSKYCSTLSAVIPATGK